MALEIRQQLKLSQQLVMTPQLQQAIKLLQLSRMELLDVVRAELEENPVLEEGQENIDEQAELGELASEVEAPEVPRKSSAKLREVDGEPRQFRRHRLAHLPGELQPGRHHRRQLRGRRRSTLLRESADAQAVAAGSPALAAQALGPRRARSPDRRRNHRQPRRRRLPAGLGRGNRGPDGKQCAQGRAGAAHRPGVRSRRGGEPLAAGVPAAPGRAARHAARRWSKRLLTPATSRTWRTVATSRSPGPCRCPSKRCWPPPS